MRILRPVILLLMLAVISTGCVLPGAVTPTPVPENTLTPTQPANPAYTSAAQTIIAQLTALAPSATIQPSAPAAERNTATSGPQVEAGPAGLETTTPGGEEPAGGGVPAGGETTAGVETLAATENPTQAPSATTEPGFTPTSPPPPSPTPASNDPRAQLGDPDWSDTFANANNWPLFEDDHVHFSLQDGGLQLLAKRPEKWDGWMLSWTTLFNFYLEVSATPQNCSGADRYGLLARAPSAEAAYLFGLTCDGQYSLRKWNGKRYTTLVDWTKSSLINKGAGKTNRLGFMADGNQISLYVNGEPLTQISDRSYEDGAFGLFISSLNTENFKVLIKEVDYWELP